VLLSRFCNTITEGCFSLKLTEDEKVEMREREQEKRRC
jgi:hypothetical protein